MLEDSTAPWFRRDPRLRSGTTGVLALLIVACGGDIAQGSTSLSAGGPDPGTGGSASSGAADTDGSGTGTGSTSGGSAGPSSESDSAGSTSGGVKYDVEGALDLGVGEIEFSNIWIANTHEGTVSKLDTATVTEVGRFVVRPDGGGSPSRTSVNLQGDLAVASREGGITKIYADVADCEDTNGTPGIQTSTNAAPLVWGEEECIAWHSPFEFSSQRALAWTGDGRLWSTGYRQAGDKLTIMLLDGEDGQVIDSVEIWAAYSVWYDKKEYGGAVDSFNDFWFSTGYPSSAGTPTLYRVSSVDLSVDTWEKPHSSYGMTVGPEGYVWGCGGEDKHITRFDPITEIWDDTDLSGVAPAVVTGHSGCMVDLEGRLWVAGWEGAENTGTPALIAVDTQTLDVVKVHPVPVVNGDFPRGISIDVDGYVWGVTFAYSFGDALGGLGKRAYRVDPETGDHEVYAGLHGAYSYSDMTGHALAGVNPPG